MMRPSAPERDAERQRAEENEETFSGSFSKKTPSKKTTISDWQDDYTFRLVVAGVHLNVLTRDRSNVTFAVFSARRALQRLYGGPGEHLVNGGQEKPGTVVAEQFGWNATCAQTASLSRIQDALMDHWRPLEIGTACRSPAASP